MAIRRNKVEDFIVAGHPDEWFQWCQFALAAKGFTNIKEDDALYQIEADYDKLFAKGEICITILPDVQGTLITATATANADTIWASYSIPGKLILSAFKSGLRFYLR